MRKAHTASKTHLMAYDPEGYVVMSTIVKTDTFEQHPLFTDDALRRERKVYAVVARVHDDQGRLTSELARIYDPKGKLLGGTGIDTKDIDFSTLAKAKKTLKLRPRGHQGLPPEHRKAFVKLVLKEKAKTGRTIQEILKDIGFPQSTYVRWAMAAGLVKKIKPKLFPYSPF